MSSAVFAIIDDDLKEISRIVYVLQDVSNEEEIQFVIYNPKDEEDLTSVLRDVETGGYSGVIIDQFLGDHGYISTPGIEIAGRMRNLHRELPIFILTKYIGDESLLRFGFSIDDSIQKSDILEYPEAFLGRLLRSTGRYNSLNTEMIHKLNQLIKKSYSEVLSDSENDQLIELKMRLTPTGLIEGAIRETRHPSDDILDQKLEEALELLNRLEKEKRG